MQGNQLYSFALGYHGILVTQEVGLLHLFSGDTSGYLRPVETNLHQYKFKGSCFVGCCRDRGPG